MNRRKFVGSFLGVTVGALVVVFMIQNGRGDNASKSLSFQFDAGCLDDTRIEVSADVFMNHATNLAYIDENQDWGDRDPRYSGRYCSPGRGEKMEDYLGDRASGMQPLLANKIHKMFVRRLTTKDLPQFAAAFTATYKQAWSEVFARWLAQQPDRVRADHELSKSQAPKEMSSAELAFDHELTYEWGTEIEKAWIKRLDQSPCFWAGFAQSLTPEAQASKTTSGQSESPKDICLSCPDCNDAFERRAKAANTTLKDWVQSCKAPVL